MKCIVLLQLGTPDSLSNKSIRQYLGSFLMDRRTISLPFILRFILVKFIIIPSRLNKVRKRYATIWDHEKGFPLRYYGESLAQKLDASLPGDYMVVHASRFGSPSIESVISQVHENNPEKIILIPLFPHETESTTGSIRAEADRVINKIQEKAEISWLPVFFNDPGYISLMANRLLKHHNNSYDKVIFSFHGLPLKHIEASHKNKTCDQLRCSDINFNSSSICYTRACYQTARDIANMAGLEENDFLISFQSRFGKRWIGPQTEDLLEDLAKEGKSVLVMAPSFMSDCLETSWEIGISFKENYAANGGGKFKWITSLNDDDEWVELLKKLI